MAQLCERIFSDWILPSLVLILYIPIVYVNKCLLYNTRLHPWSVWHPFLYLPWRIRKPPFLGSCHTLLLPVLTWQYSIWQKRSSVTNKSQNADKMCLHKKRGAGLCRSPHGSSSTQGNHLVGMKKCRWQGRLFHLLGAAQCWQEFHFRNEKEQ